MHLDAFDLFAPLPHEVHRIAHCIAHHLHASPTTAAAAVT